jgi:RNA polymerase sigma factor (sigma-70 family)
MQREEATQLMLQAVDDMPDVDREIILMRHIENRPYEEIAVLLEIQPDAARQRCGRALLKLRSAMNKLGLLEQSS